MLKNLLGEQGKQHEMKKKLRRFLYSKDTANFEGFNQLFHQTNKIIPEECTNVLPCIVHEEKLHFYEMNSSRTLLPSSLKHKISKKIQDLLLNHYVNLNNIYFLFQVPILLVGNKVDLEHQREVPTVEGMVIIIF